VKIPHMHTVCFEQVHPLPCISVPPLSLSPSFKQCFHYVVFIWVFVDYVYPLHPLISFLFLYVLLYREFHCGISMYTYIVPQFGSSPSINLPHLPLSILKWHWQVSMFHIHAGKESSSTIVIFLHPLHLASSSHYYSPLNMTCITFLSSLF
jgi:hypothetical protein